MTEGRGEVLARGAVGIRKMPFCLSPPSSENISHDAISLLLSPLSSQPAGEQAAATYTGSIYSVKNTLLIHIAMTNADGK